MTGRIMKSLVFMMPLIAASCINTDMPDKPPLAAMNSAASCDECHHYPGSILCKSDTVVTGRGKATQCSACHWGSLVMDSSFDTASGAYVFHDAMFAANGRTLPKTGPSHANSVLTLNYAQCTFCHSYPPKSGRHYSHVVVQGKKCFECHFKTVACDTITDTLGHRFFSQRFQAVPGGAMLPIALASAHINNRRDVFFRKNFETPEIKLAVFEYNSFDHSCSNIHCHTGIENGGASIERTIWKDTTQ